MHTTVKKVGSIICGGFVVRDFPLLCRGGTGHVKEGPLSACITVACAKGDEKGRGCASKLYIHVSEKTSAWFMRV